MAITKSKQDWSVGSTVKVGFLTLRVTGMRSVVDGKPDIYELVNANGDKTYDFTPHNGIERTN